MADPKILGKNRAGQNATTSSSKNRKMVVHGSKISSKRYKSISSARKRKFMKLMKGNNLRIKKKSQQASFQSKQRKKDKTDKNDLEQEFSNNIDENTPVNSQSANRRKRVQESRRDQLKQQQHESMLPPAKVNTTSVPAPVTNNNEEQNKEKKNTQVRFNKKKRHEKIRKKQKKDSEYKGYDSKVNLEKKTKSTRESQLYHIKDSS